MKGITKNIEPQSFTFWKAQANEDWKPSFNILRNPEKADVRLSLLKEQGYICAYCCCRIYNSNKTTVMEHFVPQADDAEKAIDYDNLLATCDGTKTDSETKQTTYCCDEEKRDQFRNRDNPNIVLIKPTEQDEKGFICEQAFAYTTTGGMLAKKGRFELQAKHTLDVLNLNNNELKRQREESR